MPRAGECRVRYTRVCRALGFSLPIARGLAPLYLSFDFAFSTVNHNNQTESFSFLDSFAASLIPTTADDFLDIFVVDVQKRLKENQKGKY